jgi:hypothetical protein
VDGVPGVCGACAGWGGGFGDGSVGWFGEDGALGAGVVCCATANPAIMPTSTIAASANAVT